MRLDIINAPALQSAVDRLLEGAPPALQDHVPALRSTLRRAMETHGSVRKARRRMSDPDWAQAKFAEGRTLYRFVPDDLYDWEIRDLLDDLARIASLASAGGPLSREAACFLRGLAHGRRSLGDIEASAGRFLRWAASAALRARRHEVLRQPASVAAGSLTGTRCVSVDDITRVGRRARNCLADNEDYWESFVAGRTDIWCLCDGDRLVAVLETERGGTVKELMGPGNAAIRLGDAGKVATFCQVAGLTLGKEGLSVLPDFAGPAVIDRRTVLLGKRIAIYSEWPRAVRIDLSVKAGDRVVRQALLGRETGLEHTLTLSFDPARSCAEQILGEVDPRNAVREFGRKRLRRIVGSVAMGQAVPSLVQHRLLALAA